MINWICRHFNNLSPSQLYLILQLRNEVFVVEQHCIFQDADNKDQSSMHLMGWRENKLVAYTRIVPPGLPYKEPSIGRVVTSPPERNKGTGRELMNKSIAELYSIYGPTNIKIGAQFHLKSFYESFFFIQSSEVYLEDGIEHIEMTKFTQTGT
jgi:ElaA protein